MVSKRGQSTNPARILIIQGGPAEHDLEKNLSRLLALLDKGCSNEQFDYVCLSELAAYPYFAGERDARYFKWAETVPGPMTNAFAEKARQYNCNIVLPLFEQGQVPGIRYNSAVIINRQGSVLPGRLQDGKEISCYRKVQVPLRQQNVSESYYFRPGPGYVTFDTDITRTGVLICHDRSYPEAWRVLALLGAKIVFLGVNTWPKRRRDSFLAELCVMAVQNGVFVVVSSKGGEENLDMERMFIGKSAIISPMGEILAEGPEDEGWCLVSGLIDLDDCIRYHETYHYFRDRRPELYGPIADITL